LNKQSTDFNIQVLCWTSYKPKNMEKTLRNNNICLLFEDYATLRKISKLYKISEATVREILIRKLGMKTYLQIRKEKIKQTAKCYNYKLYLIKRKTLKK